MTNGHDQTNYPPPDQGGNYPPPESQPPPDQGNYPPPNTQPPPDQGSYPPPQQGYPPPQQGYPPQGGYPPPPQQGYPPQGGYPPPQQGYPPQQPPNNTMAIVALVGGIAGLTFIPFIASIVGIVAGHVAKRQIANSQGREGGEGMATAGLVMGYIGFVLWGLLILFGILIAGWFVSEGPEFIREIEELETLFSPTPTL